MSRRERLEAKLARREEWAGKADARSDARHAAVRQVADAIPFGQPILVGHHSERHARRDAERIRSGMDKAVAESRLAERHEQKAAGIAAQLERSIFSDDANAVEAIEKRIAEREAECGHMKLVNAAFRRAPGVDKAAKLAALVTLGALTSEQAADRARFFGLCHWEDRPFPPYALTNLRGSITRDRKRLEEVRHRQQREAEAASAPGGVRIAGSDFVNVTFAEKPDRDVLDALRAAGFRWAGGSWCGYRAQIPQCVTELAAQS